MASNSERPDIVEFAELRKLVRHLGDELANFRRRALQAEARVKAIDAAATGTRATPEKVDRLERENAELKKRLEAARARTRQVLTRVRFLRQQHGEATR